MKYRIKPGYSFRDSDNSVKSGGDIIDLDAAALAIHGDKVEAIEPTVAVLANSAANSYDHE